MTLTLGLQNGRCDDCDETFGFESIFQLFVTATCRKFFSGRAVDEDLFHLFQFISIFVCLRGGSILGDLWVCQRWIVFLVAARSERVKHRSSQLRYAMELMSKRLRYEMQKENSKNPQRCMVVLMQVVSPTPLCLSVDLGSKIVVWFLL